MKMAARLELMGSAPQYNGTTQSSRAGPVWTGKVALAENALLEPLKRKKPTMYFVNSMGDLFHEDVPDEWIDQVFAVMALCPQHTFQVLTKRSKRMREYISNAFDRLVIAMIETRRDHDVPTVQETCEQLGIPWKRPKSRDDWWPLPNVWLGVSAEDQTRADERIPDLLSTPAAVRFVSAEPMLGPISLSLLRVGPRGSGRVVGSTYDSLTGEAVDSTDAGYNRRPNNPKLDWVICGGESGTKARPMHPKWAKSLRDQCQTAGTAFFFKQWGEWQPYSEYDELSGPALHNKPPARHPDASTRRRFDAICMDSDGTEYGLGEKGQFPQSPIGAFAGPDPMSMHRIGKKAAGRTLDGREWNEVPT
jgi:protein gp37